MANRSSIPVVIASGATESTVAVELGHDVVAVQVPAAWTAATISLKTSADGVTFSPVKDSGGALVSLTVVAGDWVCIPEAIQRAVGSQVQLVSSVAQAAERTLRVVFAS